MQYVWLSAQIDASGNAEGRRIHMQMQLLCSLFYLQNFMSARIVRLVSACILEYATVTYICILGTLILHFYIESATYIKFDVRSNQNLILLPP